jgi:preprotein translocase subunit SecG
MSEKRSFWRFGGRLDKIYNWLVGIFFVLSLVVHFGQPGNAGRIPEALGAAIGQTVFIAVVLFLIFKIISAVKNRKGRSS